jgi:hypothetical protein
MLALKAGRSLPVMICKTAERRWMERLEQALRLINQSEYLYLIWDCPQTAINSRFESFCPH